MLGDPYLLRARALLASPSLPLAAPHRPGTYFKMMVGEAAATSKIAPEIVEMTAIPMTLFVETTAIAETTASAAMIVIATATAVASAAMTVIVVTIAIAIVMPIVVAIVMPIVIAIVMIAIVMPIVDEIPLVAMIAIAAEGACSTD